MSRQIPFLHSILNLSCRVTVIDVGANPIDGEQAFSRLMQTGRVQIVGFEPNRKALAILNKKKGPNEKYFPYALGDGEAHKLHHCFTPGMTSLFEPNQEVLKLFHGFSDWGRVEKIEKIKTVRLADVPEAEGADFIKLDVQGAELMVLEHAGKSLESAVVIESETEFLPMYVGQPLFSEIEIFLRGKGFNFHRFNPIYNRVIRPMKLNEDIKAGLSQALWGEAIFIRDLTKLSALPPEKLLCMATIMHDFYQSFDVVLRVLLEHDRQTGSDYATIYGRAASGGQNS
jgi:FkbM family methyltransferase